MSCRHDLANGTCARCYPGGPRAVVDPGPEENYGPNLDGPGAVPATTDREEILRIERRHGGVAIYETPNGDLEVDTIMDDGAQDVFETFPGDEDAIEVVRELVTEIHALRDKVANPWLILREQGFNVTTPEELRAGQLELAEHEREGLRSLVTDLQAAWVKDHQKDGLRALARHLDARTADRG